MTDKTPTRAPVPGPASAEPTVAEIGAGSGPRIIPRSEHRISRSLISPNALKVLYRLKRAGYQAYLVGGGVRDMLLGREPKDFDVATDARPEEVKRLFRNCILIGRRFRLAHVRFGDEIVEVATFRARVEGPAEDGDVVVAEDGRILRDNLYGTLEEDAWRRDFTINALYYDIRDFSVVDYTGGMADLEAGLIRLVGEPVRRYREDPVRMLRAVRFAAKLGLRIHPDTERPLFELGHLLEDMPPARLFEEVLKLFLGGCAVQTFELLRRYGLFGRLFPQTETCLAEEEEGFPHMFLVRALEDTDRRIQEGKPVTPAFLYAALLWEPLRRRVRALTEGGGSEVQAVQQAAPEVVAEQQRRTALPKRFALPMREIWQLQPRLARTTGKRPLRLLAHPRFRAAYDFLLLRARAGEPVEHLAAWWTRLQEAGGEDRQRLLREGAGEGAPRPRVGGKQDRRRSRKRRQAAPASSRPSTEAASAEPRAASPEAAAAGGAAGAAEGRPRRRRRRARKGRGAAPEGAAGGEGGG